MSRDEEEYLSGLDVERRAKAVDAQYAKPLKALSNDNGVYTFKHRPKECD
ncbi:MAG: hypothetical protein HQL71_07520, partial [Magnetococcales bacterium]|nr:hypothetical protein [Magnetococcales bacterium]